jgi:hypothetical protein
LAAGERTLFEDCQTCFEAISSNSFFLGDVGNASKMNLVLQMISGVTLAGVAEAFALGMLSYNWNCEMKANLFIVFQPIVPAFNKRTYWKSWSSRTCRRR